MPWLEQRDDRTSPAPLPLLNPWGDEEQRADQSHQTHPLVAADLRVMMAACRVVARSAGQARAATVFLSTRGSGVGRLPLADLERQYGLQVRVLDEGSSTMPPCLRIERSARVQAHDPARPGLAGWRSRLGHWFARPAPALTVSEAAPPSLPDTVQ